MNVVDKAFKRVKYYAVHMNDEAKDADKFFFDEVARHHGLPEFIIRDRDSVFASNFWKSLMRIMIVKFSMTTDHLAQSDEQIERQHLVLENVLGCMIFYRGSDWVHYLGTLKYAYATLVGASTGFSTF